MYEEMFKKLLKLKFDAAEAVIDMLPEAARDCVKGHQQKLLSVINEVTSELLQNREQESNKQGGSGKGLKSISIE